MAVPLAEGLSYREAGGFGVWVLVEYGKASLQLTCKLGLSARCCTFAIYAPAAKLKPKMSTPRAPPLIAMQ